MKKIKYPGKPIQINLWDRIVNWFWNWMFRLPTIDFKSDFHDNQELIDKLYKQEMDRTQLTLMPPFNKNDKTNPR